jgi:hypothetical protein
MTTVGGVYSRDRHWWVIRIVLDEQALLRVLHDKPVMPDGEPSDRRTGPMQGPTGWWKKADVRSPADVERYVPLYELEVITP